MNKLVLVVAAMACAISVASAQQLIVREYASPDCSGSARKSFAITADGSCQGMGNPPTIYGKVKCIGGAVKSFE